MYIYIRALVSGRGRLLTGALGLLVVGEFTSIMIYSVHLFKITFVTDLASHYALNLQRSMNILSLIADTALATTLIVLLHRRRSAFGNTTSVINRLTQFIIGTSLVTVVLASVSLACTFAFPQTFTYITLEFIGAKCKESILKRASFADSFIGYVNCMFVSYVFYVSNGTTMEC